MSELDFKGAITIAVLVAPTFAAYAGISLDLALEIGFLFQLALSIGISIPDLVAEIALCAELTVGINLAVSVNLPSLTAQLGLGLNARLIVILALVSLVNAVLSIGDAELQAYTYTGPSSGLGTALSGALGVTWPDGTPVANDTFALILAATSSGSFPVGSLASVHLLGGGVNYERGLCSVSAPGAACSPVINPATGEITSITVTSHGSNMPTPPPITISDTVPVAGATNATPIVLTIGDTTDVSSVSVAGVKGNTAANGAYCAQVLSGTTIALYKDGAFTQPVAGNGAWVAGTGTVTGIGAGAAAFPIPGGGAIEQLRAFFALAFGSGLVPAGSVKLLDACSASFGLLAELLTELQLEASMLGSAKLNFAVVPPTIAGNLQIVAGIAANLEAALQFFPPLPSVQASMQATVQARATFLASLVSQIGAQIGISTEKLQVFTYEGPGADLGAALDARIGGGWPDGTPPGSSAEVVILGATTPAARAALTTFFAAAA